VPGNRERTVQKLRRVAAAIRQRYADLDRDGWLVLHGSVQDLPIGSLLEEVELG
jgi:hypothetical protein